MPEKNEDNDLEQELSYCGKLEKEIESDEVLRSMPKVKEKLNLLKETIEDTQDHYTLSKDPDARTGHKTADSSFFRFKTHIAMTEERIITAAVVTSGIRVTVLNCRHCLRPVNRMELKQIQSLVTQPTQERRTLSWPVGRR